MYVPELQNGHLPAAGSHRPPVVYFLPAADVAGRRWLPAAGNFFIPITGDCRPPVSDGGRQHRRPVTVGGRQKIKCRPPVITQ